MQNVHIECVTAIDVFDMILSSRIISGTYAPAECENKNCKFCCKKKNIRLESSFTNDARLDAIRKTSLSVLDSAVKFRAPDIGDSFRLSERILRRLKCH